MTATTNAEQKHYKRFVSGLLVSLGLLLLLAKTGNTPGTATNSSPLTNASDIEHIIATGTRINLTEYAENGARFYALQAQDWTQFQQQHRHVVTFDAPAVETLCNRHSSAPGEFRHTAASLLKKRTNQSLSSSITWCWNKLWLKQTN